MSEPSSAASASIPERIVTVWMSIHGVLLVVWQLQEMLELRRWGTTVGHWLFRLDFPTVLCLTGLIGLSQAIWYLRQLGRLNELNQAAAWLAAYGLIAMIFGALSSEDWGVAFLGGRWLLGWSSQAAAIVLWSRVSERDRTPLLLGVATALGAAIAVRLAQVITSLRMPAAPPAEVKPPWLHNRFGIWQYDAMAPNSSAIAAGALVIICSALVRKSGSALRRTTLALGCAAGLLLIVVSNARLVALSVLGVVLAGALAARGANLVWIGAVATVGAAALALAGMIPTGLGPRWSIWIASLETGLEAPLLGLGAELPDGLERNGSPFRTTHSSFLHAYAASGVLGATLFGIAFWALCRQAWAARTTAPEGLAVQLAVFLTACALVYNGVGSSGAILRNGTFCLTLLVLAYLAGLRQPTGRSLDPSFDDDA